jgi:hypothetical protein
VGDATTRVRDCDHLVNYARRLLRVIYGFHIKRDVAEKKIGLGRLDVVDPLQLTRHVAGESQNGRMVAPDFMEAGDQMGAAWTQSAGKHREIAGESGLVGGSQRRALLMADFDPFDFASSDRVGERIQRVADQSEYLLDPDLFEDAD